MRLKISFRTEQVQSIPINYQYPLMAAILKLLHSASHEYAKFIHESGYIGLDGKYRKLFTFSKIYFTPKPDQKENWLVLPPKAEGSFVVSSPMIDDFLVNVIIGASTNNRIRIGNSEFQITTIEHIQPPDFSEKQRFRTLSPLVLSTVQIDNGQKSTYYLRPLDEGIEDAVKKSLTGKYHSIYGEKPSDETIKFTIDRDYIVSRGGANRVSKLIHIKEGSGKETTKVKAFECPFYFEGPKELIQVAWDCGIGDKTNMGFGCIGF